VNLFFVSIVVHELAQPVTAYGIPVEIPLLRRRCLARQATRPSPISRWRRPATALAGLLLIV
jgi:hypothetical protein